MSSHLEGWLSAHQAESAHIKFWRDFRMSALCHRLRLQIDCSYSVVLMPFPGGLLQVGAQQLWLSWR